MEVATVVLLTENLHQNFDPDQCIRSAWPWVYGVRTCQRRHDVSSV